jgi:hypothetical protein
VEKKKEMKRGDHLPRDCFSVEEKAKGHDVHGEERPQRQPGEKKSRFSSLPLLPDDLKSEAAAVATKGG